MRTHYPSAPQTEPSNLWVHVFPIVWWIILSLVLGLFLASIPTYFAYLHVLTTGVVANLASGQLTPIGVRELRRLGLSIDAYAGYQIGLNALMVLGFVMMGGVLFWRKATDRMALFTAFTLITFPVGFMFQTTTLPTPWTLLVRVLAFLSSLSLCAFFYVFPTGQFVPTWTRWLMSGWVVQTGITDFLSTTAFHGLANVLFVGLLMSLLVAQMYRYRRISTPTERQQTRWVVFGFVVAITGLLAVILPGSLAPERLQPGTILYFIGTTAIAVFLLCIPLAMGIAVLRYRLWNIDLLINRTLVYGALTTGVVALYILIVAYLGTLFRAGTTFFISLVATGIVAVLFQPGRAWLQRSVNRLMYGQRDEPFVLVAHLGQRLAGTLAPEAVLPTVVETVAQALKLPYAAVALKQGEDFPLAAEYGSVVDSLVALPLIYQADVIGHLLLGPRQRGEAFTPADRRVLEELAQQVGSAAHAVRLTDALQRSRERLVTTREEERRRLRRDLHDGLGSTLTSMMFKLDATDTLLDRDLPAARTLLGEVRDQMQTSISDIRRLVYNLRPPTLDEWGLVGAIHEHVAQSALNAVQVTLTAPEVMPPLPAAVEVAVFRIVLEALANVVKHAHATRCLIGISVEVAELRVDIVDDGTGRLLEAPMGVGTQAMRERAGELGGTCVIANVVPHGTCVAIQIPIRKA